MGLKTFLKEVIGMDTSADTSERDTSGDSPLKKFAYGPKLSSTPDTVLRKRIGELIRGESTDANTQNAAQAASAAESTERSDNVETQPQPAETTQYAEDGLNYMDECLDRDDEFQLYFDRLATIYSLLKLRLRNEDENNSLLNYLGFNEEVLMKYLRAVFGHFENPFLKNGAGVKAMINKSREKERPFIRSLYGQVLQLEGQEKRMVQGQITRLKQRMTPLRQMLEISDMDKTLEVLLAIANQEADQDRELNYQEQIGIAARLYEKFRTQSAPRNFNQDIAILDRWIAEIEGNAQPNQAPQAQNAQGQPAQPAPPQPNVAAGGVDFARFNQEVVVDQELMIAVGRLTELFIKIKDPNEDTARKVDDIDSTNVAQGNLLGSAMDITGEDNLTRFLAGHFNINNNADLAAKIKEIHAEFLANNIY